MAEHHKLPKTLTRGGIMWSIGVGARQQEQEVLSQVGRRRATSEEMLDGIVQCQVSVARLSDATIRAQYERTLAKLVLPCR